MQKSRDISSILVWKTCIKKTELKIELSKHKITGLEAYHTDRTDVSSIEFGKSPDSSISSSNDHHSRL